MDRTSHDYHAHTPWPHPGPTAHGVHNTHLTYAQRAASHAIHSPSHVDHTASRTGSCTHACHLSHTQAQARRQQRCTVPTHPALHCIGTPQHSAPHRTVPHHTTPHHTKPHHTPPHRTPPHRRSRVQVQSPHPQVECTCRVCAVPTLGIFPADERAPARTAAGKRWPHGFSHLHV